MRPQQYVPVAIFTALLLFRASGTTLYVSLNSTNPVPPYAGWNTAATNIQDAVDASTNGDLILVTNGVYAAGGRALAQFDVTNRVTVTNAVVLQSLNGPAVTVIQGRQIAGTLAATNAVRCAFIGNGAFLSGFTLTNGEAGTGNYANGGGIAGAGTVSNCVLLGNICAGAGGGADGPTLIDCVFTGNYGVGGGAAAWSSLVRCTLTNNSASWAGGLLSGKATNCLVADNSATNYGGGSGFSTLVNCTIAGNWLAPGHGGNGGGSYNDTLLNCIVYDNTAPNGSNYYSSGIQNCCTAPLPGGTGNIANDPAFVNSAAGDFHLQSNSLCINAGTNVYVNSVTDLDGNARIVNGVVDMGAYEYQGNIRYVSLNSTNPIAPYSDWSIAATNIQDAVDASTNGDLVLVTNGVYQFGGRRVGLLTNRVAIEGVITVESLNGPGVTMIQGYQGTSAASYRDAVRCVWLTNGAVLSGFTLTNGATETISSPLQQDLHGGGVFALSTAAVASNCVLVGNYCYNGGGGSWGGTFIGCTFTRNSSPMFATPGNQVPVGAAYSSTPINCILSGNSAYTGGGAGACVMSNCLVIGNTAQTDGGGVFGGSLVNCTVVSNSAGQFGGGINTVSAYNSIIFFNTASGGAVNNYRTGTLSYCCTTPGPAGVGNITNDPSFVNLAGGDFHLQSN
jgi:hypothetical protein